MRPRSPARRPCDKGSGPQRSLRRAPAIRVHRAKVVKCVSAAQLGGGLERFETTCPRTGAVRFALRVSSNIFRNAGPASQFRTGPCGRRVAVDGAVADSECRVVVVDTSAIVEGRVAADRALDNRQRPPVVDPGTDIGVIAANRAVDNRQSIAVVDAAP